MRRLRAWFVRFGSLFRKQGHDEELAAELESHLQMHIEDNLRSGMAAAEARREALMKLGGLEQIKESYRERRGLPWLETLLQDLRYGARMLWKTTGFTGVAVLTLALGIGATTAIVSVVKTAVFEPIPVRQADRLVQFGFVDKERGWSPGLNPAALREARLQTNLFARVAAYQWDVMTLRGEDFPRPVRGGWVTSEFFSLWNLRPLLGRTFAADEGKPGKDDVLVMSHRLWQREFGGDPAIIGRTVPFRERPMTVVGVMPPHFSFPEAEYEYWRPAEGPGPGTDEYLPNTQVIGEMRSGVEAAQVQAFLDVVTKRQGRQFLEGKASWFPFQARGLREMFCKPELRRTLGLLLGTIMVVLFIAAANVANLQLARTETRQQELAVRAALGAGRGRVFRQLLTESLLLAVLGGAAGLTVAALGLELLQKLIPPDLPRLKPIALNLGVLGIASGVTLATGLFFGLAAAWQGRRSNLSEVLKLGAATSTRDRQRGRFCRGLIMGQVALVLVLLAGAGLMVRSVVGLLRFDPRDAQNIVRVYPEILSRLQGQFNPDPALNKASEAAFAFFADAQQRITAIPGVVATGVGFEGRKTEVSTAPGSLRIQLMKYWIGVEQADPLRVMRIPLKEGRWLDRHDAGGGVRNVVVNETAARELWPGEVAVGKRFWQKERDEELACEVVGVVGDMRDFSRYVAPEPTFYRPLAKEPNIDSAPMYLVVRATANPANLYKPIGQALKDAGADPRRPEFYNLREVLRTAMASHRAVMLYLSLFAGVGLLLAAIGLYGVLAYNVTRRTREIGIRMAMGAQTADVMRLILGQGLALVATGGVIGITLALATGRFLRAYLFGVSSSDPVTFIAIGLLLGAVTLFACWLPGRRAAKVDPMVALRYE